MRTDVSLVSHDGGLAYAFGIHGRRCSAKGGGRGGSALSELKSKANPSTFGNMPGVG
jgi:hypothetical protein